MPDHPGQFFDAVDGQHQSIVLASVPPASTRPPNTAITRRASHPRPARRPEQPAYSCPGVRNQTNQQECLVRLGAQPPRMPYAPFGEA